MTTYFADANIFIRYILQDNTVLVELSEKYFSQAKDHKIKIVFLSEIILEIEYVLRKVYKFSRIELTEALSTLLKTTYLGVDERDIFINAVELYSQKSVDLVDIFLFLKARKENAQVLSFDKDFKKLKIHDKS